MLLLMRKRQQATKEELAREDRRIRASKRDVSDYSDDEGTGTDSDIEQLQSRVRYTETDVYSDKDSDISSSEDDSAGGIRSSARGDYDDGYDSYESSGYQSSDMDDERHEMQAKIQKKYRDPRLVKSIEIQKRSLDATDLSVKKIESKKKLNAVWEGIIQRYSALGEEQQGDVVNLRDMSIEENTGHIEQLQMTQRATIWDDFVDESEGDTIQDPLNLLLPRTPKRKLSPSERSYVTPVSMSRHGSAVLSRSHIGTHTTIPPPRFELSVNKSSMKEAVIIEDSDSFDEDLDLNNHVNDDPLNLLSPRKPSISLFSSSQSTIQNHDPFNLLTPQRTKPLLQPRSTSIKRAGEFYEEFSELLNAKKPRIPSSTLHLMTPTRKP